MIRHTTSALVITSRSLTSTPSIVRLTWTPRRDASKKATSNDFFTSNIDESRMNISAPRLKDWYYHFKPNQTIDRTKGHIRGTRDIVILSYPLLPLLSQLPHQLHRKIRNSIYFSSDGDELVFMADETVKKGTYEQKLNGLWEKLETLIHAAVFESLGCNFSRSRPKEVRDRVQKYEKHNKEILAHHAQNKDPAIEIEEQRESERNRIARARAKAQKRNWRGFEKSR